jgi:hypothetical protein
VANPYLSFAGADIIRELPHDTLALKKKVWEDDKVGASAEKVTTLDELAARLDVVRVDKTM